MAIDAVTEEVALNLEEAAQATRKLSAAPAGFFFTGLVVGAAIGFYYGYRWNREKIKAEAFKESERQIEEMRETYRQKTMAATPKPTVEEVIEEKGYSVTHEKTPEDAEGLEVVVRAWDWETERAQRTPDHPYVIHQDEFGEDSSKYNQVAYTYFATDDVLVDEDNRPLPHGDLVVGQNNLQWGHGTDDENIVFVRNERLELEMEICRTPGSYEEEILGLERDGNESN